MIATFIRFVTVSNDSKNIFFILLFQGIVLDKQSDSNSYIVERVDLPGVHSVIPRNNIFLRSACKRLGTLPVTMTNLDPEIKPISNYFIEFRFNHLHLLNIRKINVVAGNLLLFLTLIEETTKVMSAFTIVSMMIYRKMNSLSKLMKNNFQNLHNVVLISKALLSIKLLSA